MAAGLSPMSTPIDASGKVRARLVGVYNYDDSFIDYVYNRQGMSSTAWCRPISLDEKHYSGISVPYHGQVYGDPRKATLSLRKSF